MTVIAMMKIPNICLRLTLHKTAFLTTEIKGYSRIRSNLLMESFLENLWQLLLSVCIPPTQL